MSTGNKEVTDKSVKFKRPSWRNSWDFLFAVVGSTVGLGNIWRFPYLCFKYGGGAFLLPYLSFALLLGIPLLILETSLGQKLQVGLTKCWGTVPIFKGIAFAQMFTLMYANASYPIVLVWSLKYFISSCYSTQPWSTCDNPWNTERCVTPNRTFQSYETNGSALASNKSISSGEEYWNLQVLGISGSVDKIGSPRLDLTLLLVALWIAIYFCTFKGIKWTAQIVYVTATLPLIFIVIIVVVGAVQDGALDGITFYLKPDLAKLKDLTVWAEAGSQVVYSYSVANGCLPILGSYNKRKHDFWRDSFLIAFCNTLTSFISGFAVFSALGFMAKYQNTTVDLVASSGPGLAFIAYPETLSLLPIPQFWCALFFLTLLLLGFDTQFVQQECAVSFFMDFFPRVRKRRWGKEIFHAVFCFLAFLVGLSMVSEGGVYVFEIFNGYGLAGWCKFLIAFFELVAIGWFYGMDRYWDEMSLMVGERRGKWWIKISWKYLGPLVCTAYVVYYFFTSAPLSYGKYEYPAWAQVIAHLMSLSSVVLIPLYAVYKIIKTWNNGGNIRELFRRTLNDSDGHLPPSTFRLLNK